MKLLGVELVSADRLNSGSKYNAFAWRRLG